MLPTDQVIENLHRKYAKTATDFHLVYTHCQIIESIAMQLLDAKPGLDIDRELVRVGCLLHDIGAYGVLEEGKFIQGVRHGIIGEKILKDEGFPETIWRFASHHTGVGLTKEDVQTQKLPLPLADYVAETDEERLLMYADAFHSKGNPPLEPPHFCTLGWFRNSLQKFGHDKAAKLDTLTEFFGKPKLDALSKQFGYTIKDI
jgi:uncharacterized protein